jgi:hypothetical protein
MERARHLLLLTLIDSRKVTPVTPTLGLTATQSPWHFRWPETGQDGILKAN